MALSARSGRRTSIEAVLRASAGSVTASLAKQRILVAGEVAVTFVVLTMAGLLARSAWDVERIDVGFDADRLQVAYLDVRDRIQRPSDGVQFFDRLQARLEQSGRIDAVTMGQQLPLASIRVTDTFTVDGIDRPLPSRYDVVGPRYFTALRIAVLDGRDFDDSDREGAPAWRS